MVRFQIEELTILVAGLHVGMREGKESKVTLGAGLRARWMKKMRLIGVLQEFCFSRNTLVTFLTFRKSDKFSQSLGITI